MNIPLLVLLIVFVLIAVRQVGRVRFQIWHIMLLGAITVLVTGQISPTDALAAGSTIAGNLLILGAASNVIIIHNAERKSGETLTFLEFAKVGIPLTIINMFVYWLFLSIF